MNFAVRARRRLGLFGQGPFAVYWSGGLLSNVGIVLLGNRPFTALAALAATFGVSIVCTAATVLVPVGLIAVRVAWRSHGAQSMAVSAQAAP